jgi:hypothetical protein
MAKSNIDDIEFTSAIGHRPVMIKELPTKVQSVALKYDHDGNGSLDPAELVHVISDLVEAEAQNKKSAKQIMYLVMFNAFQMMSIFGLVIAAIFLAKDTHTEGGKLVDNNGHTLGTAPVHRNGDLYSSLSNEALMGLQMVPLEQANASYNFKVIGSSKTTAGVYIYVEPLRVGPDMVSVIHAQACGGDTGVTCNNADRAENMELMDDAAFQAHAGNRRSLLGSYYSHYGYAGLSFNFA